MTSVRPGAKTTCDAPNGDSSSDASYVSTRGLTRPTEVATEQRLDLVVRDWRRGRVDGWRSVFDGRGDQSHRTARFEQVVDHRQHRLAVGPVDRLAERHQARRREVERGEVLGSSLDPCRRHMMVGGVATRLREHLRLGVDADHRVEQRCQLHREDARSAADVDQRARPVEPDLGAHHVRQLRRVRRSAPQIVRSRRRVRPGRIAHHASLAHRRRGRRCRRPPSLVRRPWLG